MMPEEVVPIVDVFAGPGGLGEGFSAFAHPGLCRFRISLSVEKDPIAWQTLSLRCFFRQFGYLGRPVPDQYYQHVLNPKSFTRQKLFEQFPVQAKTASQEAWHAALGDKTLEAEMHRRVDAGISGRPHWVLIGGPPCQAYSLAGRSRNSKNKDFKKDPRHFLYEEYLRIIARHWPSIFVMENVKGILTSKTNDGSIFPRIRKDLGNPGAAVGGKEQFTYRLHSLVGNKKSETLSPEDFVIEAEKYGIPQARHRVILLGIRSDLADQCVPDALKLQEEVSIDKVLTLPYLRSGLSRSSSCDDSWENWVQVISSILTQPWYSQLALEVRREIAATVDELKSRQNRMARSASGKGWLPAYETNWFVNEKLQLALNHDTRSHRDDDLHRYLFAACYAKVNRSSPTLADFPSGLLPDHENAERAVEEGGNFSDRFRVQRWGRPATTITCHIAKDGHYYIHPDPLQCRSLTVREAARIQTFPDDYFFCGPRTEQYTQVGNAVPPLLARQVAAVVARALKKVQS